MQTLSATTARSWLRETAAGATLVLMMAVLALTIRSAEAHETIERGRPAADTKIGRAHV